MSNRKAFTGSCTLDMDFAEGDDIIDGADITSTGFCAEGSNGQSNDVTTGSQPWGWIKYFAAYNRRFDDPEVEQAITLLRYRYNI